MNESRLADTRHISYYEYAKMCFGVKNVISFEEKVVKNGRKYKLLLRSIKTNNLFCGKKMFL
jgi:hypothetical protein